MLARLVTLPKSRLVKQCTTIILCRLVGSSLIRVCMLCLTRLSITVLLMPCLVKCSDFNILHLVLVLAMVPPRCRVWKQLTIRPRVTCSIYERNPLPLAQWLLLTICMVPTNALRKTLLVILWLPITTPTQLCIWWSRCLTSPDTVSRLFERQRPSNIRLSNIRMPTSPLFKRSQEQIPFDR